MFSAFIRQVLFYPGYRTCYFGGFFKNPGAAVSLTAIQDHATPVLASSVANGKVTALDTMSFLKTPASRSPGMQVSSSDL